MEKVPMQQKSYQTLSNLNFSTNQSEIQTQNECNTKLLFQYSIVFYDLLNIFV